MDLEAEGRRLKKKLDTLKNMAFQLEALEKENVQLEDENLELRRSAETLRSAGAKAAQLEAENRELESERSHLKRSLELLKASSKKTERLEVNTTASPFWEWRKEVGRSWNATTYGKKLSLKYKKLTTASYSV